MDKNELIALADRLSISATAAELNAGQSRKRRNAAATQLAHYYEGQASAYRDAKTRLLEIIDVPF